MRHTESIAKLAPALVKAQSAIEGASQSGENTHLKSKYATLEDVIEATRSVLAENGLGILQIPGHVIDGKLHLETMIFHESGEYIVGEFQMTVGKGDPQSVGSALTYARRYAQKAGLNIPDLDDDGQGVKEAKPERGAKAPMRVGVAPAGDDWPGCEGRQGKSSHECKQDGTDEKFKAFRSEIGELESMTAVGLFRKTRTPEIALMPKTWRKVLWEEMGETIRTIEAHAEPEETFPDDAPAPLANGNGHDPAAMK
jgi:hypothetical protein